MPTNITIRPVPNVGVQIIESGVLVNTIPFETGNAQNVGGVTITLNDGETNVKTYTWANIELVLNGKTITDIEYAVGMLNNEIFLTTPDDQEGEMIFGGDYDNGVTYKKDTVVFYGGATYISTDETTGHIPTNTSYWRIWEGGSSGTGQIEHTMQEMKDLMLGTLTGTYEVGTQFFDIIVSNGTFAVDDVITGDNGTGIILAVQYWPIGTATIIRVTSGTFSNLDSITNGSANGTVANSRSLVVALITGEVLYDYYSNNNRTTILTDTDNDDGTHTFTAKITQGRMEGQNIMQNDTTSNVYYIYNTSITYGLTPGQQYKITDDSNSDLGVVVTAVSDHELSPSASAGYLNVDWDGIGDYSTLPFYNQFRYQWQTISGYINFYPQVIVNVVNASTDPVGGGNGWSIGALLSDGSGHDGEIVGNVTSIITIGYNNALPNNTFNVGDHVTGTDTGFTGTILSNSGDGALTVQINTGNPYGETEITDTDTSDVAHVTGLAYQLPVKITSGDWSGVVNFGIVDTVVTGKGDISDLTNFEKGDFLNSENGATGIVTYVSGGATTPGTLYLRSINNEWFAGDSFTSNHGLTAFDNGGVSYYNFYDVGDVVIHFDGSTWNHYVWTEADIVSSTPPDQYSPKWLKLDRQISNGYIEEWRTVQYDIWGASGYYSTITRVMDDKANDVSDLYDNARWFPWGYAGAVEGNVLGYYSYWDIRGYIDYIGGTSAPNGWAYMSSEIDSGIDAYEITMNGDAAIRLREGIYWDSWLMDLGGYSFLEISGSTTDPFAYISTYKLTIGYYSNLYTNGYTIDTLVIGSNYHPAKFGSIYLIQNVNTEVFESGKSTMLAELDTSTAYDSGTKKLTLPDNWFNQVGVVRLTDTPSDKIELIDVNQPGVTQYNLPKRYVAVSGESFTITPTTVTDNTDLSIICPSLSDIVITGREIPEESDFIELENAYSPGIGRRNRQTNLSILA